MKIKTMVIIMLLYGLIFGSFYTYLKSSQLKEPLFLTHYYQKEIIEASADYIPIYYVTNQGENWQLVNVQSKELPGQTFFVEHDDIRHQEGIYYQHEAIISIKNLPKDEVLLEELAFTFSNGTVVVADIGAIQLRNLEKYHALGQVVNMTAGGSSNSGESYSSLDVILDSQLTGIELQYEDILSPILKLAIDTSAERNDPESLNLEDLKASSDKESLYDIDLPVELKDDDRLRLNVVADKDLMYKNDIHAIEADIMGIFQTDKGEVRENLMRITEQPYLTSEQIKELKKLREEGEK